MWWLPGDIQGYEQADSLKGQPVLLKPLVMAILQGQQSILTNRIEIDRLLAENRYQKPGWPPWEPPTTPELTSEVSATERLSESSRKTVPAHISPRNTVWQREACCGSATVISIGGGEVSGFCGQNTVEVQEILFNKLCSFKKLRPFRFTPARNYWRLWKKKVSKKRSNHG